MTFDDVTIPKGSHVFALSHIANRDPEVFENPHQFDVRRSPNDHVSFGFGVHSCLGNHLARIEVKAALGALLRELPGLSIDGPMPIVRDAITSPAFDQVHVKWDVPGSHV